MSDDYDDEDEPGGLWDPDAFNPPPAPARPALHIVATPGTGDRRDRRAGATDVPEEADQHTLVRLEQFRTASERPAPRQSHANRPKVRRAAAAGILASVVAAIAVAYGTVTPPQHSDQPGSTPRAAAGVAVDSEHAAATRQVASTGSRVRQAGRPRSRAMQHTKNRRRSVNASQNRLAPPARHTPTVSVSHAPATSTPTTIVRTATPTTNRRTPVASATSEFGFEG
jgi:hypothetical protein